VVEYYKNIVIVKSKLFFQYGKEGQNVSHMLLKYLDKLDLFDIMDLIQGKANHKLWKKISMKTNDKRSPIKLELEKKEKEANKVVKFNMEINNLNISISISFIPGQRIKDGRSKHLFKLKHKISFNISILDVPNKINVVKHTHTIHTKEQLICKDEMSTSKRIIPDYFI
jgi:hypothetical protein